MSMTTKLSGWAIIRQIATSPAVTAPYAATLLKYTENILSTKSHIQDLYHCFPCAMDDYIHCNNQIGSGFIL